MRKVTQLLTYHNYLVALCDDGTVWTKLTNDVWKENKEIQKNEARYHQYIHKPVSFSMEMDMNNRIYKSLYEGYFDQVSKRVFPKGFTTSHSYG